MKNMVENIRSPKRKEVIKTLLDGYEITSYYWELHEYVYFDFNRMSIFDEKFENVEFDKILIDDFYNKSTGVLNLFKTSRKDKVNLYTWCENHWLDFSLISRKTINSLIDMFGIDLDDYSDFKTIFEAYDEEIKAHALELKEYKENQPNILRSVYIPELTDTVSSFSNYFDVWVDSSNLREELDNDGLDYIKIHELKTSDIDFAPVIIDSDEYNFDEQLCVFIKKDADKVLEIFKANAQLIIAEPFAIFHFFKNANNDYIGHDSEDGKKFHTKDYTFSYLGKEYMATIKNYKHLKLMVRDDNDDLITIFEYDVVCNYSTTKDFHYVSLPKSIFEEYHNSVISNIEYNSDENGNTFGEICFDNESYGLGLNGFKIGYKTSRLNVGKIKIADIEYEVRGHDEVLDSIEFLRDDIDESILAECISAKFLIEKTKPSRKWVEYNFLGTKIALDGNKVLYVDKIKNGTEEVVKTLEYLDNEHFMYRINELNELLDANLKPTDFTNDISFLNKDVYINFREHSSDTLEDMVGYLMPETMTKRELNEAILITKKIRGFCDGCESYDDVVIELEDKFPLKSIPKEEITKLSDDWYILFEKVMNILGHSFKHAECRIIEI